MSATCDNGIEDIRTQFRGNSIKHWKGEKVLLWNALKNRDGGGA